MLFKLLLNSLMLSVIAFSEPDSPEFGPGRCQYPCNLTNGDILSSYLAKRSGLVDIVRRINLVSIESELREVNEFIFLEHEMGSYLNPKVILSFF